MRHIMASAALCALLSPLPATAQSDGTTPDGTDVYRNDLPETHDGVDLPEVAADAASQVPDDLQQAYSTVSAGALAAQQYGNLAAAKYAGGAVRDLGDRMVMLNSAINDRLGGDDDETLSESVRADLEVLDDLNGPDFDRLFTTWVTTVYPGLIEGWSRLGENEALAGLSQAVTPELEDQLKTARNVLEGEDISTRTEDAQAPGDETGEEGQIDERQHTPEPEQPEVQSGENYEHEKVEVDPASQTRSLPDADQPEIAPAAGELDIVNPGIVFALIEDPSTELAQAVDFSADQVRVVSLEDHLPDADLGTLDSTISEHQSNLSEVRDAVGSQQMLSDALEQAGTSVEDVIAFDVLGEEGIVLYTRSGR